MFEPPAFPRSVMGERASSRSRRCSSSPRRPEPRGSASRACWSPGPARRNPPLARVDPRPDHRAESHERRLGDEAGRLRGWNSLLCHVAGEVAGLDHAQLSRVDARVGVELAGEVSREHRRPRRGPRRGADARPLAVGLDLPVEGNGARPARLVLGPLARPQEGTRTSRSPVCARDSLGAADGLVRRPCAQARASSYEATAVEADSSASA